MVELKTKNQRANFVIRVCGRFFGTIASLGLAFGFYCLFIMWLRYGVQHKPGPTWSFFAWENLQIGVYALCVILFIAAVWWSVYKWIYAGEGELTFPLNTGGW